MKTRYVVAALVAALCSAPFIAANASADDAAGPALTAADYDRAARVLEANLAPLVKNATIAPHWLPNAFWYSRDGESGTEFVLVDAASGEKRTAFDPGRLSTALASIRPGLMRNSGELPVSSIVPAMGGLKVTLDVDGADIDCLTATYACQVRAMRAANPDELASPDGRYAVFREGDDIGLRDLHTGEKRRLTTDGRPEFAYGTAPDDGYPDRIAFLKNPLPLAPEGIAWSPDGRYLVGSRVDQSAIEPYPYMELVPQNGGRRPQVHYLRVPIVGDRGRARHESFIIESRTGRKTVIAIAVGWQFIKGYGFSDPVIHWSEDGRFAYGLIEARARTNVALVAIELASGATRLVVSESGPASVWPSAAVGAPPNVRILDGSAEALWYSQRDGWGHLYVYDLRTGKQKRRLTSGEWLVRGIIGIDQERRLLYFTAGGREPGIDPYRQQVYRVSLDGGEPTRLTPEDAHHEVIAESVSVARGDDAMQASGLSPDHRYFVDTYSTIKDPPITVLRSTRDGRIVARLETADASAVYGAGWRAPERVRVRSADGRSDVYAAMYFPRDYTSQRRYPVIDAIYGGPQATSAPVSFMGAVASEIPMSRSSLAQLGFIVVTIDGRGTPGRSKAFNDATYRSFDPQIDDHVAAIRQLALRYGSLDLDRVGVYGHSFGGDSSARAILAHPEFYKVAVSSSGTHDPAGANMSSTYFLGGVPDYGEGSSFAPDPAANPRNYAGLDNRQLASNLSGHLLLAYGDLDENVMPYATVSLVAALQQANKTFDLLYLPNASHQFYNTNPYFIRRMWDYFVEHLLGARPPRDYALRLPSGGSPPTP